VAERALAIDPSLTLVSLRQLAEAFAEHAAARAGLVGDRRDAPVTQLDLLRLLEQRNIVRDKFAGCFHMLRRVGNAAVHNFLGSRQEALDALAIAYRLACWFHETLAMSTPGGAWLPPLRAAHRSNDALRALQEDLSRSSSRTSWIIACTATDVRGEVDEEVFFASAARDRCPRNGFYKL
jgi:type I restriction enzyme R subunit